eukprot:CAMPEP_0171976964 /NCGR_PEP_ID=MMETSP0993-20121228/244825_1 /TAXON_ID=483369 /ORGANISM="non described non described, Strain CCMP2098" /LENGTH=47 /DNA_ID= /DNA_START= /DNA_END= /DNA_ORIENTATION=
MGTEDSGLSSKLLDACDAAVAIPCLSASMNVGHAFAAVLTVHLLSAT